MQFAWDKISRANTDSRFRAVGHEREFGCVAVHSPTFGTRYPDVYRYYPLLTFAFVHMIPAIR